MTFLYLNEQIAQGYVVNSPLRLVGGIVIEN